MLLSIIMSHQPLQHTNTKTCAACRRLDICCTCIFSLSSFFFCDWLASLSRLLCFVLLFGSRGHVGQPPSFVVVTSTAPHRIVFQAVHCNTRHTHTHTALCYGQASLLGGACALCLRVSGCLSHNNKAGCRSGQGKMRQRRKEAKEREKSAGCCFTSSSSGTSRCWRQQQ